MIRAHFSPLPPRVPSLSACSDRRRQLAALTPLDLAVLILDYGITLTEDCDPIERILRHEVQFVQQQFARSL